VAGAQAVFSAYAGVVLFDWLRATGQSDVCAFGFSNGSLDSAFAPVASELLPLLGVQVGPEPVCKFPVGHEKSLSMIAIRTFSSGIINGPS
jgi:hypothetical protein